MHPIAKVSEELNYKCPPRNTTVQLRSPYTDPERRNAQRYRQTDVVRHHQQSNTLALRVSERIKLCDALYYFEIRNIAQKVVHYYHVPFYTSTRQYRLLFFFVLSLNVF